MAMFDEVALLRQRLTPSGTLEVMHAGHLWTAKFEWFPPVSIRVVEEAQNRLGKALPNDYVDFLTGVSNGATLFKDAEHGQWGYQLYGADDIVSQQQYWQRSFPRTWQPHLLALAEALGDANVMVFDLDRISRDSSGYAVLEGNAIDPVSSWPTASRTFHEWLDHLVTAQGDRYWEWK